MSNKRNKKASQRRAVRAPGEGDAAPSADEQESLASRLSLWPSALKIVAGSLLVAGVAGSLAWGLHRYARTTPRFAIDDIAVEGARRLSRAQLLELASIHEGDNVFSVDAERAEGALLANPWVESARVTRRLPGHVRVEVRERTAKALLVLGPKQLLVSAEGLPFKTVEPGDPHDLPLLTGLSETAWARDSQGQLARLSEALGLLADYEQQPLGRAYPVEELHLDERGHATLTVGSQGVALHLGQSPWKQKLLRAGRILGKAASGAGEPGVVFLDNEAHPERVVVRVK